MDFDPLGTRLPIKIDSASNGEFAPRPLNRLQSAANAQARERVALAAKKTGLDRRTFLKTLMGSAATLLAFNQVYARAGVSDGRFAIPAEAAYE
ncbi:MAG: amidohydrolase, partial [Gammaproteobacteria bacterium]